jgi:hypothetical protein
MVPENSQFRRRFLSKPHAQTHLRASHPDSRARYRPVRTGSTRSSTTVTAWSSSARRSACWTDRYPLIVEAALRNRASSFVLDGEAVLLGVDGVSDFDGLHSRRHDAEVQLHAFDAR